MVVKLIVNYGYKAMVGLCLVYFELPKFDKSNFKPTISRARLAVSVAFNHLSLHISFPFRVIYSEQRNEVVA